MYWNSRSRALACWPRLACSLTHSPAPLFVRPTEDSGRAQVCMFQTLVPAVRSAGERLAATGGCTFRHVPRAHPHSLTHALTLSRSLRPPLFFRYTKPLDCRVFGQPNPENVCYMLSEATGSYDPILPELEYQSGTAFY